MKWECWTSDLLGTYKLLYFVFLWTIIVIPNYLVFMVHLEHKTFPLGIN